MRILEIRNESPHGYMAQIDKDESSHQSLSTMKSLQDRNTKKTGEKEESSAIYQQSLMELDEAIAAVRYLCKFQNEPCQNEWQDTLNQRSLSSATTKNINGKGLKNISGYTNNESIQEPDISKGNCIDGSVHSRDSLTARSLRSALYSKRNEKNTISMSLDVHSNHSKSSYSTRSTRSIRFNEIQVNDMDNSLDGTSNHSQRSFSSSSAWSSVKSRAASRLSRSRSSSRSLRRKELNLVRTVRMTILDSLEADSKKSESSENTSSSKYSTDDILQDLEESRATLLTGENGRSSKIQRKQEKKYIRKISSATDDIKPPLVPRLSRTTLVPPSVDDSQHPLNMLPPLVESQEDDAVWLQSRVAEPRWADIERPPKLSTTEPMDDKNTWNPWLINSSFDEWGFEEAIFPNTTYSTVDNTADVTSGSNTHSDNNQSDSTISSSSRFDGRSSLSNIDTTMANSFDRESPKSVIQSTFQATKVIKSRLPYPPLTGTESSSPSTSSAEKTARIQRFHRSHVDRIQIQ